MRKIIVMTLTCCLLSLSYNWAQEKMGFSIADPEAFYKKAAFLGSVFDALNTHFRLQLDAVTQEKLAGSQLYATTLVFGL